jgi:hypothetical protein
MHSDLRAATVASGPGALDRFLAAAEGDADLLVTAWSTLQSLFTYKVITRKDEVRLRADTEILELVAGYFTTAVIDEIHLTGNHLSLRFAIAVQLLQHCHCKLGLTGTPLGRDPFKLWAQTYLIDDGETLSRNYYFFESAFGLKRKNPFKPRPEIIFDKSKLGLLTDRLGHRSLSCALTEIQEVNILRGTVELPMYGEQKLAYQGAIEAFIELRSGERQAITNAFIRLRQIASGYMPFSDEEGAQRMLHFGKSSKLEWLAEFIEAYDGATPCVIFHEFTPSGKLICEVLAKARIKHGWLHGGAKDRAGLIDAFRSGRAPILVANTATGGVGIDLPEADYLLFFESPVSPTIRQQAEARPMARGSRALLLDDLICAPIERRILGFVAEGRDMLAAIINDPRTLLT